MSIITCPGDGCENQINPKRFNDFKRHFFRNPISRQHYVDRVCHLNVSTDKLPWTCICGRICITAEQVINHCKEPKHSGTVYFGKADLLQVFVPEPFCKLVIICYR